MRPTPPLSIILHVAAFAGLYSPAACYADAFNLKDTRIRSADGRPCLVFRTQVRREIIMTEILDHFVTVKNICPTSMTVRLCYHGSHNGCRRMQLSAYREETTQLGAARNQVDFSFDYEESEDN